MKSFIDKYYFCIYMNIIILLFEISNNIEINAFIPFDDKKCQYLRVEKMLKAKCHDMNLREVPQYLSSGAEVLDLSYNRIRRLKKTSFRRYRNVKYLLLYDNMIQTVEPETFSYLDSLEEIDLSNNALLTIPVELFELPSLRNLYMDSNDLRYLHEDLNNIEKPIKAPLEYLNIADCGLSDIPYLGILPNLWHLNASSNPLDQINIEKFSPLCNLKSVDLDKSMIPPCSCQMILIFFGLKKIKSHSNFCDISMINKINDTVFCQDLLNITFHDDEYDACKNVIKTPKIQISWFLGAVFFAALFILLIILVLCVSYIRTKRKKARMQKFIKEILPSENYLQDDIDKNRS